LAEIAQRLKMVHLGFLRWHFCRRPEITAPSKRGLASALADCCDALAIAGSKSASGGVRAATALVSGLSAGVQVALAGRLIR